ncbi:MAG: PASTA domain-containing protein [Candidatus Eremiobacteraeota bacterium]|nr:PASTA domain-containing protein [Candidatus Eremiobacteraeota bacterium]
MEAEADSHYRKRDWQAFIPKDWVFPLALALFVGVVVWFSRSLHDFLLPAAGTVSIPLLAGQTIGDANIELARLHLKSAVAGNAISDRYPKGVVMSQQPDSGSHVREGRLVSLIVSSGVQIAQMPDLRYESTREVGLALSSRRLQLGKVRYQQSDEVPAGHVIDQDPEPLTNVHEGVQVNLVVSKGGVNQLRVPNFVGLSVNDMRVLAAKDHLKIGQIVWTPLGAGGPAHGQIVRQTPAAGTQIDAYEVVSVDASAGPHESGRLLHQTHVIVSVPISASPGQALKVRVEVSDATGQYNLYDAYAQSGQKLDFNVTAVGSATVGVFVNNVLLSQSVLGVEPANVYGKPSARASAQP